MQDDTLATARTVRAALLGTAVGDALGLPFEGLSASEVLRHGGRLDRFMLAGRTGFVSDDTEQSALVLQSVLAARGDVREATRRFRWALLGFFLRLPFGIGLATLRAPAQRRNSASFSLTAQHTSARRATSDSCWRISWTSRSAARLHWPLDCHALACNSASMLCEL